MFNSQKAGTFKINLKGLEIQNPSDWTISSKLNRINSFAIKIIPQRNLLNNINLKFVIHNYYILLVYNSRGFYK